MTRGGKRPTQSALVVVGDRNGRIGIHILRATASSHECQASRLVGLPTWVMPLSTCVFDGRRVGMTDILFQAMTRAARHLVKIDRYRAHTINHEVHSRFKRTRIYMLPSQPGSALVAHSYSDLTLIQARDSSAITSPRRFASWLASRTSRRT